MASVRGKQESNCIGFYLSCKWLPIANGYFMDVHSFEVPLHYILCAQLVEDIRQGFPWSQERKPAAFLLESRQETPVFLKVSGRGGA